MQVKTSPDVSLHRKHWKRYICLAKDCKSISSQPCLDIRSILAPQMSGCERVSMLTQYVFRAGVSSGRSRRGRSPTIKALIEQSCRLETPCAFVCVYLTDNTSVLPTGQRQITDQQHRRKTCLQTTFRPILACIQACCNSCLVVWLWLFSVYIFNRDNSFFSMKIIHIGLFLL